MTPIGVRGRREDGQAIRATRIEVLTALKRRDASASAVGMVDTETAAQSAHMMWPSQTEPDLDGVNSAAAAPLGRIYSPIVG